MQSYPRSVLILLQRLKAAVHYTVGCLCEEVASDKEMQFSKQTIAAISEMTFQQCGMQPRSSCRRIESPEVDLPGRNVRGWGAVACLTSRQRTLSLDTVRETFLLLAVRFR